MKLALASRNPHKLDEIRRIVNLPGLDWLDSAALADMPEVVEDGLTFASNAIKKAVMAAFYSKGWAMADDSGLEVNALGGAPGVISARYAGAAADYAANNAKLLRELAGQADRSARFCCVVALASPRGRAQVVEGYCSGRIIEEYRGGQGFGYDPLFVPDGYDLTFAEMDADLKNRISHRARAFDLACRKWGELLCGDHADWPAR